MQEVQEEVQEASGAGGAGGKWCRRQVVLEEVQEASGAGGAGRGAGGKWCRRRCRRQVVQEAGEVLTPATLQPSFAFPSIRPGLVPEPWTLDPGPWTLVSLGPPPPLIPLHQAWPGP